jgi:NADH-quinone oxidoreductase subunit H
MSTASIVIIAINILLAVVLAVGLTPIFVWWERRVAGFVQDRTGPNRCHIGGFRLGGLVQSVADMLKLFFKEDFTPSYVRHKIFYTMAPGLVFLAYFFTFAVIPFADNIELDGTLYAMQAIPVQLGIMWFIAYAGLSVYGIILGGYASSSKFGLLSAVRATAQVVSYEAALSLALISMLLTYNSIHLNEIVQAQSGTLLGFIPAWGVFMQPLAALIFIVALFAETNRTPFDLAEGESELVAGYHTEYSAMRFGLFQVSEFAAMAGASAIIVTLLFGGYQVPYLDTNALKENMTIIILVLMFLLPISIFFFTQWIKKNNVWPDENDIRFRETAILVKIFYGIAIISVLALAYLLIGELSVNGTAIAVAVIQVITFLTKFFMVALFFIFIRWTLLRFRYDQLQMLGWKVLLPLALLNIAITASVIVYQGL